MGLLDQLLATLLVIAAPGTSAAAHAPPSADQGRACSNSEIKAGDWRTCNPCTGEAGARGDLVVCDAQRDTNRYRIPKRLPTQDTGAIPPK